MIRLIHPPPLPPPTTKCRCCGAPAEEPVSRNRSNGYRWTQDWQVICSDKVWNARLVRIHLDADGLCQFCHCRKQEVKP